MQEARFYSRLSDGRVRCDLCPHLCIVTDGHPGKCKVRSYKNGILYSENYGRLSAVATDPIEKKPLYHFYPGEKILSIGSLGCNMHCKNCQNENISQCIGIDSEQMNEYRAEDIAEILEASSGKLLAFTYNEPTIFYEFMFDTAKSINDKDIECVMVTNGYINPEPLRNLLPFISGFNVDLKSYSNRFYKEIAGAALQPVLNTIDVIKNSGKHLEITYLVIGGLNDDPDEFSKLVKSIRQNLGRSQVLHLSRYFPSYKMRLPPTPVQVLRELADLAREELDFVYPGNVGKEMDANTYCPYCGNLLVKRQYYDTIITSMQKGVCVNCSAVIEGKFRK
jgi:pyruvate formate lyase activating enzyme